MTKTMDECFSKPHPQMINEILDFLMIESARALMIGDSSYDLEMAANAKVDSLGVTYGAQNLSQLQHHNPLAIIENPHDLFSWLTKNG
jgi:phosphoglycolate phosphatase